MTKHRLIGFLVLSLSLFLASTCATTPISKQYRAEAKAIGLTFSEVLQNPGAYVGDTVIWGGDIIETINTEKGTKIVVLEKPLNWEEKPQGTQQSRGRFMVVSPRFLDPAIYKKGRKVTLAGVVEGMEALPLGETTYAYPVIQAEQIHLWENRPHYSYGAYNYWGWGPYEGWGWGAPFGYFGDFDDDFRGEEGEAERGADRD